MGCFWEAEAVLAFDMLVLYRVSLGMQAKYLIKVQMIRSKAQAPRFHVNFPLPLAAAIGLEGGEEVQWELLDRGELHLLRPHAPAPRGRHRSRR
jgi:hypothetical protein